MGRPQCQVRLLVLRDDFMREAGTGPPPAPPPLEPAVDGGLFIDVAPRAVLGLHRIRDEIDSTLFTDGALLIVLRGSELNPNALIAARTCTQFVRKTNCVQGVKQSSNNQPK